MRENQNKISWWRTSFGDEEMQEVTKAIQEEHISQGIVTEEFEARIAKILDVPFVTATSSGSTALLMALMALGIKPGDEVIVPNRTWIATAHAAQMLGAKVILVDVLPDVPIMDVSQIRKKITSRTKAIMPVSLNGRVVDLKEVQKIANENGLRVIEDAAQAFCSKNGGEFVGTTSDAGCFSLSVAKLISTGQGGFVVTKNKETYQNLKRIRTHGVDDVINCTFFQMGFNFRITDLQSSIGIAQLGRVEQRIAYLKTVYAKYEQALKQFPFLKLIPVAVDQGEIPIYIEVLCNEREKLISFLASQGIQTRPFYPDLDSASHLNASGEFPNSRVFSECGLVLPCGPSQPLEKIDYVIETLQNYPASKVNSYA